MSHTEPRSLTHSNVLRAELRTGRLGAVQHREKSCSDTCCSRLELTILFLREKEATAIKARLQFTVSQAHR